MHHTEMQPFKTSVYSWIAPINVRLVSFTHSHPHELQVFYAITMVGWHTEKKKMFLTLISQLGITTSPLNNWMSWKYNKQSLVCVTKNTTHCSLDVYAGFFLPLRNDWLFSHCFSYIFCVRISTSCVEHIAYKKSSIERIIYDFRGEIHSAIVFIHASERPII